MWPHFNKMENLTPQLMFLHCRGKCHILSLQEAQTRIIKLIYIKWRDDIVYSSNYTDIYKNLLMILYMSIKYRLNFVFKSDIGMTEYLFDFVINQIGLLFCQMLSPVTTITLKKDFKNRTNIYTWKLTLAFLTRIVQSYSNWNHVYILNIT